MKESLKLLPRSQRGRAKEGRKRREGGCGAWRQPGTKSILFSPVDTYMKKEGRKKVRVEDLITANWSG
jgi:hypothetical protein